MFNWIKKRWYLLLIFTFVVLGLSFRQVNSQADNNKDNFYTVRKQTTKETLSLSGKINAEEKATLRFQTSGRLAWVGVKTGDYVNKYQVIASLDQRDVKNNLEKKLNTFMKNRWDLDQSREDYKDKAITDEMRRIMDKAQYDVNNSVVDVELQNLAVEYSNLVTPIEGVVTEVTSPYAGVNMTPTQAEFEVINPKSIYFSVTAEQTEVVQLKKGMSGEIVMDAYPNLIIKGTIQDISFIPITSDNGNTYEVKMIVSDNNDDLKYKIGMTGDVTFVMKERSPTVMIPTSKIKTERDKKYVYRLVNNNKIKTFIKTGEEIDENTIVISGLKTGDILTN